MQGSTNPPDGFPEPNPFLPKPNKSRPIIWEILMIIGLILMLLIPLNMVGGVITERQRTRQEAIQNIIENYGGTQTVTGPILAIPYKVTAYPYNDAGQQKAVTVKNIAYLFPENYSIRDSSMEPQFKHKGIFQLLTYTATLKTHSAFNLHSLETLNIPKQNYLWDQAYLITGITDQRGLKEATLQWEGKRHDLKTGTNTSTLLRSGLYSSIPLNPNQTRYIAKLDLRLQGSDALYFASIGRSNKIEITPNWHSISYRGSSEQKTNAKGIKQDIWQVDQTAFGQAVLDTIDLHRQMLNSTVGMQLLNPVDSYRQTERAIKYSILFLVLTFSTYFILEIIGRQRLHLFQYLLVGLALSLFYLLLVAISEVSQFPIAYGIASLATILMITMYSKAILGKIRKNAQFIVGGLLTALYSYLYTLLQLEDLSLLFGAIGLFVVLGIIMFVTRNIDWYNEEMT
jgi:inner membrane protein